MDKCSIIENHEIGEDPLKFFQGIMVCGFLILVDIRTGNMRNEMLYNPFNTVEKEREKKRIQLKLF